MTIQHKDIPEAQLHEAKGASTAAADKIYVADGAGSGVWKKIAPTSLSGVTGNGSDLQHVISDGAGNFYLSAMAHGSTYFVDITTPYTLTYPAAYTKVAPTTTATGNPTEVTENTTCKLIYTGTPTRHMRGIASICFSQSVGANRDIRFAIYKNGSIISNSETISTAQSAIKNNFTMIADITGINTNDYFEVYARNDGASGDIVLYSLHFTFFSFN